MKGFLRLAALLLLAMPLVVACRDGSNHAERQPTPVLDEENLTLESVYAAFARAITRPGFVYHATTHVSYESDEGAYHSTRSVWADVGRDLAREETESKDTREGETDHQSITISANGGRYGSHDGQNFFRPIRAVSCFGVNAAASMPFGCPSSENEAQTVEMGKYEGQTAIILTTEYTQGEGQATGRVYLDRSTLLLLALQLEGRGPDDSGTPVDVDLWMPCENEFVPADSLPVDFFDPASIGYAEPDFEAELAGDFGITVYWLGEDFPGNAYLPPLTLSYVQTPRRVSDPIWGEQDLPLMLDYYLASDPYGEAAVWIQEYGLSEWNAKSAQSDNWWNGPCWDRQDIHLPNGNHATIISPIEDDIPGETCPSGPYDRFGALVYLGTSTIEVSGNFHDSGCGNPQIPITPPRE